MPRQKQIKITKDGQEGYCVESSVAAWERNGWTRADDEGSEEVTEHPIETQVQENAPEQVGQAQKTRKA